MNDQLDPTEDPGTEPDRALARLLARADVWADAPDLEDAVVASIAAAAATAATETGATPLARPGEPSADRSERRPSTSPSMPWWLAAAAVVALLVAGVALVTRGGDEADGIQLSLAGTEAAPGASASVTMAATPAGLKIVLDAEGLAPAPDGYYYEAWVSDGTIRVSAGGFHLRDGHGPIELWAGVADPAFHILSVTLEPIDADTDSSGDIRLTGEFDLGT
jgi:hypothetical protein